MVSKVQDRIVRIRMRTAVFVASLCILAVCALGQDTSCFANRQCHDHHFTCSDDQDPACIDRHCSCLTTHTCTHTSECSDVKACRDIRHREVCYQGKCHCADLSDVIGGIFDNIIG